MLVQYLYDYYEKTGELHVLEEIISSTRNLASLAPKNSKEAFCQFSYLGEYLHEWYKKSGCTESLSEATEPHKKAIQIARNVLASTTAQDKSYIDLLMEIGRSLYRWYTRTKTAADLAEAIRLVRRAIDLTSPDSPGHVDQLMVYGRYISHWSEEIGPMSELKEGIELVLKVAELAPDDILEESRPIARLIHFTHMYYHLTREVKYLEQSIKIARRGVDMIPKDNPNMTNILHELVFLLSSRYESTRALADLKEMIKMAKYMIDTTPPDHPNRVQRLHLYASQLHTLCTRNYTQANMNDSIETSRLAVDLSLSTGVSPVTPILTLSRGLLVSFAHSRDFKELEESIQTARDGVRYAVDEGDQAFALSSLSSALYKRYTVLKEAPLLNEAIDAVRRATELSPTGRFGESNNLVKLATYLLEREQRLRTGEDLEEATHLLIRSTAINRRPYFSEVVTMRQLASAHGLRNDLQGAFDVATRMIELVPTMMPNSLENDDKQWVLLFLSGVASLAAYAALRLGKPAFVALDVLERGRGLLGTSLEGMRRTDIWDVQKAHPDLAQRFFRLKTQLEKPFTNSGPSPVSPERVGSSHTVEDPSFGSQALFDGRYRAGIEFERVMEEISKLSGFETFHSPPNEVEVRNTARYGPLVIINEFNNGYDAIIVEQHQIRALPLPRLLFRDVSKKIVEGRLDRPSVLEWLWDSAMSPILDALGYSDPVVGDDWPHVWWIPTGFLSKFPLHAAGYHSEGAGRTVLDCVVSSYSSSVKSVIYGRRRRRRRQAQHSSTLGKAVLIAMENTPRHSRLPFAAKEVEELNRLCKTMKLSVVKPPRTKSVLLENLQECNVHHFAGHGYTDRNNASQSYLCLEGGPDDLIRVADLLELDLHSRLPFLAYLSACGTGQLNEDTMSDESIHLISSCQLAGFRHVIGTLWEVNDEICVDVAKVVYEGMRDGEMSDASVARGLHNASRLLRDGWVAKISDENDEVRRRRNAAGRTREIPGHSAMVDDATGFEKLFIDKVAIGDQRVPRDMLPEDHQDDMAPPLWAPYVHYGI